MDERAVTVTVIRDGNAIIAMTGPDLQVGISGCGDTAADALRELATALERESWPLPELDPLPGRPVRIK
jgi:hypothetical protein